MRKQGGGSIVNISSVQGKIAIPYRSACKCCILYCTHLNSFALAQQTILKIGNIKSKFSNIYTSIAQPNQIILNDIVCNILFTIAMTTHTWYIYRCSFQTCSTGILWHPEGRSLQWQHQCLCGQSGVHSDKSIPECSVWRWINIQQLEMHSQVTSTNFKEYLYLG